MSLYEIFFELELGICERFVCLSPFDIRRTRASEVFLLVRRLNNYNEKNKKEQSGKSGKKVIRKPAGDDWF